MTESPRYPATSAPSRWRVRVANAHPEWNDAIDALAGRPLDRAAIEASLSRERKAGWTDEAALKSGLRRVRAKVLAALIDRDLAGGAGFAEVVAATTALAEVALGEAYRFLVADAVERHGTPRSRSNARPQDLLVVGMGKLGGGELNVSSDIDLVFVYAEDGDTDHATRPISNQEFFTRLGRRLIVALAEVTADGFVFRVDMRLRPDGEAGPLVAPFTMLEHYLLASARDWERFAWVKGRVVSPVVLGSADASEELARLVTPFVYRRYLDFDAIDALRRLHAQIRQEAARREAVRAGRSATGGAPAERRLDVKLGRGGIREIEFIAQQHQLVRGGRDPALRQHPTLATLTTLVARGLIDAGTATRLREAYVFLRDVEHRLQYLDDAQTHVLPPASQEDDRARVARMSARLVDLPFDADAKTLDAALLARLEHHRGFVAERFESVFGNDMPPIDEGHAVDGSWWAFVFEGDPSALRDEAARERILVLLEAAGFEAEPADANRLIAFAAGARYRGAPATSRSRIALLIPRLVESMAGEPKRSAALARWLDLIEAIVGRSAYLALLVEYPAARANVTRLLAASPWAAQFLTRHPLLLDELLEPRDADATRDGAGWAAHWMLVTEDLARRMTANAADTERQMDVLREVHHAETFRLLIDDLHGRLTVESLSDQLSALADLVLDAAIAACWSSLRRDDWPEVPAFAAIAFGKLGGKELGYASDLDLVFLYDERESDDEAEAVERYVRFARRLNVWLTARTSAGSLFEIDLRLRPDGEAGMVVSSFAAWSRYERRERDVGAWTWEHQALTRARFAAGDRRLALDFERERVEILASVVSDDAGRARLRADIAAMRVRMHDGHPNRSGLFDLKHDEGGMVDIEFAVQYLVLAYGGQRRELLDDVGNIALLRRAADAGLVDRDIAAGAADAYRTFRARQHAARLAEPDAKAARVAADAYPAERRIVRALWEALFDGT